MPTPLDRALNSKNLFVGFTALVSAAAAWSIWGGDIFPSSASQTLDPAGDPKTWTEDQMRTWLHVVSLTLPAFGLASFRR